MSDGDDHGDVYRELFEAVSDAILVYDPADRTVVDANPAAATLTGHDVEDLIGAPVAEFSAGDPEVVERAASGIVDRARDADQRFEWAIERPGGEVRTAEVSLHRAELGGRDRVLAILRDVTDRRRREEDRRALTEEYESLLASIEDAIFILDVEGGGTDATFRYRRLNAAHEDRTGLGTAEIRGRTPREVLGEDLGAEVATNYRRCLAAGEPIAYEEELPLPGGTRIWETKLAPVRVDGEIIRIVGFSRDVTERVTRERALRRLYEIGADTDLRFEGKIEAILEVGREFLALPYGFMTSIEGDTWRVEHALGDHDLLGPGTTAPLEEAYCRETVWSEDLVGMEDTRAALGEDDPAYESGLRCYVGTKVRVRGELRGTFCFADVEARDRQFTADEREVVKLIGQWAGYELEREEYETRLRGLHGVSADLLLADSAEEVGRIAVGTGRDLFDLPVTACWEYDAASDTLQPLAETEACVRVVGSAPTFERGAALARESYEAGEIRTFADLTGREGVYNPDTPVRSEVHVPLGDHGLLITGSTEPAAFDDVDVESLRLLGALVREALSAVERERRLADRGERLQEQNERLEAFADIVAHDLRNPLTGAVGSLEIARETGASEFFDRAERSLERMDDLIGELLDIARAEREPVTTRDVALAATVEEAWSFVDAPTATLTVEDDLGEIHADETRLLQLLANLFRNSVEHAGPEVMVEVGRLPDAEGFYVADDGPGLPPEIRAALGDDGSVDPAATGIGLVSVGDIVSAHEWTLAVPETRGGARFEFRVEGGAPERGIEPGA